jgi:hypothetical protein
VAIVTFVLVGLGVALIVAGATISIVDWNRRHKEKPDREVVTEGTSLPEVLKGLAKLAEALKEHQLGMQLIIVGIVVLVIAGIFGGVAQL